MTHLSRTLLALLAVACVLAPAAPAHAAHGQTTYFEAPRDLHDTGNIAPTLNRLQGLGVTAVRQVLHWSDVAPDPTSSQKPDFDTTDPASYHWGVYDAIVQNVKARGMTLLLTVSGPPPKWATKSKRDDYPDPIPSEFTQFMVAVARHYGDQIDHWSIWNEPNQPQFLQPQFTASHKPASPAAYRQLYLGALKAFANVGMKPSVLFGETSPRGNSHIVAPLAFLRGALCLSATYKLAKGCGLTPMAGYAHHAYTTGQGPSFTPPGKDDVTIGVLPRLESALAKAAKAGAIPAGTPTWLTEFGIQSLPDPNYGVSLQRQAEYRAISEHIAYDDPHVAAFSQYLLTDDDPGTPKTYSGFESGLITAAGRVKPSLDAFRLTLAATRTSPKQVALWGLIRPAAGSTKATVQYRNGASGAWRTLQVVTTDTRGYLRGVTAYRSGRQYRLSWVDGTTTDTGAATRVYAP